MYVFVLRDSVMGGSVCCVVGRVVCGNHRETLCRQKILNGADVLLHLVPSRGEVILDVLKLERMGDLLSLAKVMDWYEYGHFYGDTTGRIAQYARRKGDVRCNKRG